MSFSRVLVAFALFALIASVSACGSPETPPAATSSPAAAAPAPTSPGRVLEGYAEAPPVTGEMTEHLDDLERDVRNLISGAPNAAEELAGDLHVLVDGEPRAATRPAIDALVKELGTVLPAAKTDDAFIRRLAELLFLAGRGFPLSETTLTKLSSDVQSLLSERGAPEAPARAVAGGVAKVARAVRST